MPEIRALARAISLVEDESPAAAPLVAALFPKTGRAWTIGITGPPGAGKSTLVDRLATAAARRGATVGIVAVDPTSPFTGGAILGDRVRMQAHAGDAGVFIRSMATRGNLGGLARTTTDAALLLDAAGRDYVIIETVGVGQDEVDIVRTADVCVVTLVPGTGDDVQALKAGIMEIADIFVVNKADREGADRTVAADRGDAEPADRGRRRLATSGAADRGHVGRRRRRRWSPRWRGSAPRRRALIGRAPSRSRRVSPARAAERPPSCSASRSRAAPSSSSDLDRIAARDRSVRGRLRSWTAASQVLEARLSAARVMKATLDHIGVAVTDLPAALAFYRDALGLDVSGRTTCPAEQVRATFVPVGRPRSSCSKPTSDVGDRPVR